MSLKVSGLSKGMYRRHMKVISYLGTFDRLFGVPVTTRNWNTITAIARVLGNHGPSFSQERVGIALLNQSADCGRRSSSSLDYNRRATWPRPRRSTNGLRSET